MVWVSFLAAMTITIGVLSIDRREARGGFLAANITEVPAAAIDAERDPLFSLDAPLDTQRWTGIVVHHLGKLAGDAESVHRLHLSHGLQGLGYHFVIGNGNGLGDGVIHVGYRWNQQQPGAHVAGPAGDSHNLHSIGICLVGNGDRRSFTDKQIEQLNRLVQRLQRQLNIPAHNVRLNRDLVAGTDNPGRFFPAGRFREQLLD